MDSISINLLKTKEHRDRSDYLDNRMESVSFPEGPHSRLEVDRPWPVAGPP